MSSFTVSFVPATLRAVFNEDRIRVTHVGSLARPPELQEFLRAYENGEAYDEAAFEECLRRSVADVVRQQRDTGIDVVSDGEFGKTQTWAWYIRDRLEGFEERPIPPSDLVGPRDPSRLGEDRRVYADFYADYFRRDPVASGVREHGMSVCVGPIRSRGQAAIKRDVDDLKAALEASGVRDGSCPSWRRRARSPSASTSTTKATRSSSSRWRMRSTRSTAPSSTPGSTCRSTTRTWRRCTTTWSRRPR